MARLALADAKGEWECLVCGKHGTYQRFAEGDRVVMDHLRTTHDRILVSPVRKAQGEDGPPCLTFYVGRALTAEEVSLDCNQPHPQAKHKASAYRRRPSLNQGAVPLWRRPF
jgi:hypothetical protein